MATTTDGIPIVSLCFAMDAAEYLADDVADQVKDGTNLSLMEGFVPTVMWGELLSALRDRSRGDSAFKVTIYNGAVIVTRANEAPLV